jgi:hypothetical protein
MRRVRPAIRRLAAAAIPLVTLLTAGGAGAVEVPNVGGRPLQIDVTNTTVVDYHFNNRNDGDGSVGPQLDDFYGEWLDRLNVQASYWRLRLGVRLDSAVFFHTPSRADVESLIADQKPSLTQKSPADLADYRNLFYDNLHTRYRRSIYPSKLFLGYNQPGIDVTVGDFYVQLGRGLVFSVRKVDELAVDTTVRGVKVVADKQLGDVRLGATVFAGQMNPQRVDETSGRRLQGTNDPLFFGFPTAGDLHTYDISSSHGQVLSATDLARPSYLEDTAGGVHLEVGTKWFTIAANGAMLFRTSHAADYRTCQAKTDRGADTVITGTDEVRGACAARFPDFTTNDPSKEHNRILNASGSITVPSILKHGDVYLEVAGQQMGDGHLTQLAMPAVVPGGTPTAEARAENLAGYAVYLSGSISGGPVSISLEGKHYRNYFPLAAHIDTQSAAFGAPEFALVSYSQAPTAEPTYAEVVRGASPQVCVTGGRARLDYRFDRETSVYGWLGRYASWSEKSLGNTCTVDRANQTNTWDAAVGAELGFEHGKSHVKAWVGARTTDYAEPQHDAQGNLLSTWFYREGYVRYDIIKHLAGSFSLQLQGVHRHRTEPLVATDNAWTEGENYTALQWSPHLSAIFGYEYLLKNGCQPLRPATLSEPTRAGKDVCHFFNGGLQWRNAGAGEGRRSTRVLGALFDTVSLFVGQRRGALRCVSGVCRQFPPFEGARLEVTSRF